MSIDDGSRAEADDDSPNPLEAPFLDDPSAPEPAPEAPWDCGAAYYELIERVGKGAFAEVFAARCSAGARRGTRVGIKIIDLDGISSDMEDIRQEVATLRLCSHPNVIQFYASFVECRASKHELWLVTQLMAKGSCLHVMTQARHLGLPPGMHEDWIVWILKETLQGLRYFHEHQQIHRDIKAGNILLDASGAVALADFGVSRWINKASGQASNDGRAKTFVGTPCWMAPEVMEQLDGYDSKADIWSLGITALELAKAQAPYAAFAPMKVLLYTIQNDPPSLSTYPDSKRDGVPFSRTFKDLVRMCLQKDPSKRPTCSKLLSHALFTQREPSPAALVTDLLDKVADVGAGGGEALLAPGGGELPGTRPVDLAQLMPHVGGADAAGGRAAAVPENEVTTRAGYNGAGHSAAAPQTEEAPGEEMPAWSFGETQLRADLLEAAGEAGIQPPSAPAQAGAPPPAAEAPPTSDESAWSATGADRSGPSGGTSTSEGGLGAGSPAKGGKADPECEDGIVNEHHSREDQDAYVASMDGAVELMSEEEFNDQRNQAESEAQQGHDEVLGFINQLGGQIGEFDGGASPSGKRGEGGRT
mmetsp:Transcript_33776/g.76367  ORF Transcript_33776/g.76367 Transcript_33776/m.76367 type:complete len:589 (-) Transcript_33776:301-2067(-)